ncbi:uncharacterized protein LOC112087893 isoform X3 [Eutrema salsugineum]|uniref:uncharacterized protein LOC112087893 isoform X3 n=1 Tax=Eutrema salsugineum TaxID=72664 RepID=UPI000CED3CA8|nr:uncharacterized protein LOC112087893 isoform X3 [Eutrema salsugineum]
MAIDCEFFSEQIDGGFDCFPADWIIEGRSPRYEWWELEDRSFCSEKWTYKDDQRELEDRSFSYSYCKPRVISFGM